MHVSHSMRFALTTAVAGVLAACGGGGSGGLQDVAGMPVNVSVTSDSSTVASGKSFMASALAVSKPVGMKTMAWSVTPLTAGAVTMTLSNTDCANGTRNTRTVNGITQSDWACDSVATAPIVTFDSTYRLSFTGVDQAGNASTGHRDITVTSVPTSPTAAAPVASTPASIVVTAGDDVGLNCFAVGGAVAVDSKYVFQWAVKSNPSGLPLTLSVGDGGAVSFKAPSVRSQSQVTLQCRVTDDTPSSGASETRVTIFPSSTVNAIANAGAVNVVEQAAAVVLDASASTAPGDPVLFFKWTQVEGPTVSLSSDTAVKPTFVAPLVTETTRLLFQLTAMASAPANPANAAPSELAVASVYVVPLAPLSLSITAASVVLPNFAVALTANVAPTRQVYYAWTQVSGPEVTLVGANTSVASFISPNVTGSSVDTVFSVSVSRKPLAQSLPNEIVTADVIVRTAPRSP